MKIAELKRTDVDVASLEDLVGVRSELKILATNYDDLGIDCPEWVSERLDMIEKEISFRTRAEKQAELKKLKAQAAALMSRDERKALLNDKIEKLENALK